MKFKILSALFILAIIISGCAKKDTDGINNMNTPGSEVQTLSEEKSENSDNIKSIKAAATAIPEMANNEKSEASPVPEEQKASSVNANTKLLAGRIICIDPGHGNPNHAITYEPIAPTDSTLKPATAYGTTGVSTKIPEYKLTMTVSLKIRDRLIEQGAKVVMTRENNDVDLGNIERSEIANSSAADISVRIHADGFDNPAVEGISVLYPGNRYISDKNLLAKSKAAAQFALNELVSSTNGKSRGIVERNDLTGFNWSKVPVILVEMGFMTNPSEDEKLNTDEYQNKIADGVVNGLIKYFESL